MSEYTVDQEIIDLKRELAVMTGSCAGLSDYISKEFDRIADVKKAGDAQLKQQLKIATNTLNQLLMSESNHVVNRVVKALEEIKKVNNGVDDD